MTCIVGLVGENRVWIGGDSAGANVAFNLSIRKDKKVFRLNEEMLIGFTTSFRMGQLLQYSLVPPPHPKGMSAMRYMVSKFTMAVRECFTAHGFMKKEKEREEGGEFLVAYRGHVFRIFSDFQVAESTLPFNACGCGANVALGALYAIRSLVPDTSERKQVKAALGIASKLSSGVEPPFVIRFI